MVKKEGPIGKYMDLTKKEKDIMDVLWKAEVPLSSSEICKFATTLNIELNLYTVQVTVSKLEKKGLLKVGKITRSGNALARAFIPAITPEQLAKLRYKRDMETFGRHTISGLVAALLDNEALDDNDIEELKRLIDSKRGSE